MRRFSSVQVDRVEEGIAVCYSPEGGMTDVALTGELISMVHDGDTLEIEYSDNDIVSVRLIERDDDDARRERRNRLDSLFKKN